MIQAPRGRSEAGAVPARKIGERQMQGLKNLCTVDRHALSATMIMTNHTVTPSYFGILVASVVVTTPAEKLIARGPPDISDKQK